MNKTYRVRKNRKTETWVAVPETARGGVKASGLAGGVFRLTVLAGLLLVLLQPDRLSYAAPSGGVVQAGSATIDQQGLKTTITNSNGAIINWQGFSIGIEELVRFQQSGANSAVLNRVVGDLPSSLLGALQSNGKVFLINNKGILVGANARINTRGLVLSTSDLSNEDFLAGRMHFSGGAAEGAVVRNDGDIQVGAGGSAVLLGETVHNNGVITAQDGTVVLAGGNTVTLSDMLNPAIQYTVSAPAGEVVNVGRILAGSGRIEIAARSIEHRGILDTSAAQGGEVVLVAAPGGSINIGGTVDASSSAGVGGNVTMVGDGAGITLGSGAVVRADGSAGGGRVTLGGELQGGFIQIAGANLGRAGVLDIEQDAQVSVSATDNGDGGRMILWGDHAGIHGSLHATGGASGGNGGFIETSGTLIDLRGVRVCASAPQGRGGEWLIDPANIWVLGNIEGQLPENVGVDPNGNPTVPPDGYHTSYIYASSINTVLNSGTNVTITNANDQANIPSTKVHDNRIVISASATIRKTGGAPATLALRSEGAITVYGNISGNVAGSELSLNFSSKGAFYSYALAAYPDPTKGTSGQIDIGGDLSISANGSAAGSEGGIDSGAVAFFGNNIAVGGNVSIVGRPNTSLGSGRAGVFFRAINLTAGGNISIVGYTPEGNMSGSAVVGTGRITTTNGGDINITGVVRNNVGAAPDSFENHTAKPVRYSAPLLGVERITVLSTNLNYGGLSPLGNTTPSRWVLDSSGSVNLVLEQAANTSVTGGLGIPPAPIPGEPIPRDGKPGSVGGVGIGIGARDYSTFDISAAKDINITADMPNGALNGSAAAVRFNSGNLTAGRDITVVGVMDASSRNTMPVRFEAGSPIPSLNVSPHTTLPTRLRAGGNITITSRSPNGTAGDVDLPPSITAGGNITINGISSAEMDARVSMLLRSVDPDQGPLPLTPDARRTVRVNGVLGEAGGVFGAIGGMVPANNSAAPAGNASEEILSEERKNNSTARR